MKHNKESIFVIKTQIMNQRQQSKHLINKLRFKKKLARKLIK